MEFTIQVKKKNHNDDNFSFEDLILRHGECNGGWVEQEVIDEENPTGFWVLFCARCYTQVEINSATRSMIVATALDGRAREGRVNFNSLAIVQT